MIQPKKPKRIVIIGAGGIGSHLAPMVAQHLAFIKQADCTLVLVDGDKFEAKNTERQNVVRMMGNKAQSVAGEIEDRYPSLEVESVKGYVGEAPGMANNVMVLPVSTVIQEGDWVLCCVDNNRTRLIVSKRMQQLNDCVLMDGGNEMTDGSVQVYIRHEGKNLTPTIEKHQPGIENPVDKAPYEIGCDVLAAAGEVQILATNTFVATMLYVALWRLLEQPLEDADGIASVAYFDITRVLKQGPIASYRRYPTGG